MSQAVPTTTTTNTTTTTTTTTTTNASVVGSTSSAGPVGSAEFAIHEYEIAKIKKDLEKKGEAELQSLFKEKGINSSFIGGLSNGAVTEQSLMSIMQRGFDEFKEKTGQTMSYSDMRDLYG